MIAILSGAAVAQEKKDGSEKKAEPIGLSFGIDYYSNYLWRGTKFFNGDGAFIPKVAWNVLGSGLVLSVAGEISSSWVFNGFSKKPGKYDYRFDSSGGIPLPEQLNFNHARLRDPEPGFRRGLFLHASRTPSPSAWVRGTGGILTRGMRGSTRGRRLTG